MRYLITFVALICVVATVGCSKNKKSSDTSTTALNSSVTDIATSAQPPVAYSPAPQPAAMTYDTSMTSTPSTGGSSYTVKKGDTLYGIARAKYGDGKQYTKIVSANPGVTPQSLKVGQTLVIP